MNIVDLLNNPIFEKEIDRAILPLIQEKYGKSLDILKVFSDAFSKGYVAGFNAASSKE